MGEKAPAPVDRPALPSVTGFSNAVRLSGREWIGVGIVALLLIVFAPSFWERVEPFEVEADYRMPYDLSADYWLYERYARQAAALYDTLLVGDSVIWGQYVTRPQTLSHYLNEGAGAERFANLGLDGAHPTALAGLLEHYGGGITNKNVLMQCNPLWLSSKRHDLQTEEGFPFNHPRLVPQFVPSIPCYKEEMSPRLGIMVEQHVPFTGWTQHLQQAYFERTAIPDWTVEHPEKNPLAGFAQGVPPSDNTLRHEPIAWTERGIQQQDFAWVEPAASFQWQSFQRAMDVLQRRGNRVFVLIGPFNEHMLSARSLHEYRKVQTALEARLRERGVPCAVPAKLPTAEYADASHPLSPGYARLAAWLMEEPSFRSWSSPR